MGYRKEKYKGIFPTVFNKIKRQAEERKIDFDITIEYIGDLFEEQNKKCAFTGIKLTLKKSTKDTTQTASLDRKDSSKGYIKGNVWWVDKRINKLKSDFEQEEFLLLCKKVANYNQEIQIKKLSELLTALKNKNGT